MANRVIFSKNATTVLLSDGTKTTVKAHGEPIDHEKGLAMAVAKRVFMDADGHWKNKFNKVLKDAERDELKRVSGDVVANLKNIYNDYYDKHVETYLNVFNADAQKDICNYALKHTIRNRKKYIPTNTGLKTSDIEAEVQNRMEEYSAHFITQHPITQNPVKNEEHDKLMRISKDVVEKLKVLYNEYYDEHIARYLNYYNEDGKKFYQKDICNRALKHAIRSTYRYIPKDTELEWPDIFSEVRIRMETYSENFIAQHPIK